MTYADIAALEQAAADVDSIGTSLEEATLAALTPTSTMLPAGADEISTAIAALFNSHATEFQQIAALAQRFHARFGQLLGHAADAYQCTEQLGLPGTAVADLLQPDLRVLVDLGYASGQYADIPTPAQLFGIPNPQTVLPALATGTVQGLQAFGVDVGLLPQSMFPNAYPYLPSLDLGLNIPTGQPSVTAVSLLTGAERQVMDSLGLIPSCAQ